MVESGESQQRQDMDHALIEQYKLFVQSAENVSDRRIRINRYQTSLNLGVVALHGLVPSFIPHPVAPFLIALAGIALSVNWFLTLWSFRETNRIKYVIIHSMERRLPKRLFQEERFLSRHPSRHRGRKNANGSAHAKTRYARLRRKAMSYRGAIFFERPLPVVFAALHLTAVAHAIYRLIGSG